MDLDEEYNVQQLVKHLIGDQLIQSAHDVSDGGLAITLIESALKGNFGFSIDCDEDFRRDAFLFGESQSRIIVSVSENQLDDFVEALADYDCDFTNLGLVTNGEIVIDGETLGAIEEFKNVYENSLGDKMK
jgi:phosphoribosylformylglycinamidine (FGAM) synthase-like enzyme